MLNLNVGILGHVDSGKTSLAKAISEIGSTAAFDKNPQSQKRGITLDLGFSSFTINVPTHIQHLSPTAVKVQLTLVDCPGHASLIRTIIGGAQIIDLMLLVIDITKGIQTQTAECLVIGEITCKDMVVVLNKIDLLEEAKRSHFIEKTTKKLKQTLSATCFAEAPVVSIAANPKTNQTPLGIDGLVEQISKSIFIPSRNKDGPFLFAIDHCFGIKGRGTVLTGTVLQGTICIDDVIDLPAINLTRKIKSLQTFRQPVSTSSAGDRVGMCVTQFDPQLIERGIACHPGLANFIYCGIISVHRIKYFKGHVKSKAKFHITVGYETSLATVTHFNNENGENFDFAQEFQYKEELNERAESEENVKRYLLLEFERPVLAVNECTVIGSKLDMDAHANQCRIAFWGKLLCFSTDKDYRSKYLNGMRIYKNKQKMGVIKRAVNENTVIVKNMFKKETNLDLFLGLNVSFSTGDVGVIESSFGQSGKIKVHVKNGLSANTMNILNSKNKDRSVNDELLEYTPIDVILSFKKYVFNANKKIVQ